MHTFITNPYCKSSAKSGRQWIGIDQSDEAIKAITTKLNLVEGDLFVKKPDYKLLKEQKHSTVIQGIAKSGAEALS